MENEEQISYVIELMEAVIEDNSVPRNIRKAVDDAKNKISEKLDVTSISSAMYLLDDISNDINMPSHTRTDIWTIISELESVKERIK